MSSAEKTGNNVEQKFAYAVIGISLAIGLVVGGLMFYLNRKEKETNSEIRFVETAKRLPAEIIPPDRSRQLVDFALTDRTGRRVTQADLRGKIVVVDFLFTGCALTCPTVSRCMEQIQDLTSNQTDVVLLSLTVDPRDDTVDTLADYGSQFHADTNRWFLLTGDEGTLYNVIGQSFLARDKNDPLAASMPGSFAHTERIALVDAEGNLRGYVNGLSTNAATIVVDEIRRLRTDSTARADTNAVVHAFAAQGVVRQIAPDRQSVTIKHGAISNYMPAMTMDFAVKNTNDLATISPGDEISFTLVIRPTDDWVQDLRVLAHHVPVGTNGDRPRTAHVIELKSGDLMPDEELTAEDGRTIRFSDFRGKVLAFTFIYTRCPLPDYCPRMSRNFQAARDLLLAKADAPTNWQFLSISFDPNFDTPQILSNYADYARGNRPDRWLFAVAPMESLVVLVPDLNLMVRYENNLAVSHNLRTVVLGPDGRIDRLFDGNKWTPQELADAMVEAAKISTAHVP
ncbi:MAG TPA: SCO family protein [Verrucomicrobiae bacterium]|nr:SCO family protein [Verrucomicrobiae bacterium]